MTNDLPSVGDRLKFARKLAGYSKRGLSLAAGVAQALVGQIEKNPTADPHGSTLKKLADVLGLDVGWLLEGPRDGKNSPPTAETIRRAPVPQEPDDGEEVPIHATEAA